MKKLFLLSLVIFSISQSSFAWSPFIWRQKPKPASSNTKVEKKVDQLGRKVSGVKQNVTDLDNKVNSLDQKVTEIDNEVVKIGQDVTKIDQKTTELDQKVISLNQKTTTIEQNVATIGEQVTEIGQDVQIVKDDLQLLDSRVSDAGTVTEEKHPLLTRDGKFIGNVVDYQNWGKFIEVKTNDDFKVFKISPTGKINTMCRYLYAYYNICYTYAFTEPDCTGDAYIYMGYRNTDISPNHFTMPNSKGEIVGAGHKLYYYPKNAPFLTGVVTKSYSFDFNSGDGYENCYENKKYEDLEGNVQMTISPDHSYIRLYPNDPKVTGIDSEYPFPRPFSLDGYQEGVIDLQESVN